MKEIIYVQAGNFSNYIGTHFWNAQESYFTFDDDEPNGSNSRRGETQTDLVEVNHSVSFREGLTSQASRSHHRL